MFRNGALLEGVERMEEGWFEGFIAYRNPNVEEGDLARYNEPFM